MTWTPAGVAVVVLASCLGVGWVAALVAVVTFRAPVTPNGQFLIESLGQTLAGALAVLLGVYVGGRRPGAHS